MSAQDTDAIVHSERTGGVNNGRYWNSTTTVQKISYVYAVFDALVESVQFFPKSCECGFEAVANGIKTLTGPKDPIPIEVVEGLDIFFKDPANRQIRIIEAIKYVALKASGASKEKLDDFETSLRRVAANTR
jgi:hypothetical protein